ncbi:MULTISPECIES: thioesterase II family protein [unclassified Streptomyces]|uniref:thioesterase II family protein n=1 Tax=unclassified Streptomyces TaxID=2593676 RepID=UPI0035E07877
MSIHETEAELWIRRFHPAPEKPIRLVCLPHAGGTASYFFRYSQILAATADVLTIQYPGRQDRRHEPPLTTVSALADRIHRVLAPYHDRPLVLFGHSMGGILGFELARRMEREGRPPSGLIVSGRRAPDIYAADNVHTRGDEALIAEMGTLSGTAPGVLADEEILRMVLPAMRADFKAIETYRYRPDGEGPALDCPLSVLTGASDPRVTLEQARAWRQFTNGPFTFRSFPGGHFFLTPQQDAVTAAIAQDLASLAQPATH